MPNSSWTRITTSNWLCRPDNAIAAAIRGPQLLADFKSAGRHRGAHTLLRFTGIIRSGQISYKHVQGYSPEQGIDEFLATYTAARRRRVRERSHALDHAANWREQEQDLGSDRCHETGSVVAARGDGPFTLHQRCIRADTLNELVGMKGRQTFRHEVVPVSLTVRRFVTGKGEWLANNVAGYDHAKLPGPFTSDACSKSSTSVRMEQSKRCLIHLMNMLTRCSPY